MYRSRCRPKLFLFYDLTRFLGEDVHSRDSNAIRDTQTISRISRKVRGEHYR